VALLRGTLNIYYNSSQPLQLLYQHYTASSEQHGPHITYFTVKKS